MSGGDKSSRFHNVTWNKVPNAWQVQLWGPQTKRNQTIGYYASELDAARAYDCAAVKLLGLGTKRNFPAEVISEPPATVRGRKSSRFTGVSWTKNCSAWKAYLWNLHTERKQHIGLYDTEEAAAMAYVCAAVELHGPDWPNLNFPGEFITKAPASLGDAASSRYKGVSRRKDSLVWDVRLHIPKSMHLGDLQAKRMQHIGRYDSEVDAAMALDCAAAQLHGPHWPKLNFRGKVITKPPESRGDEQRQLKASR
ncbi:hypothetical protein FOA52_004084 [Chlamydomonas sp. UWO 241]|nr:hypothetical protein FOA52_004084 [Chlamydomonas sp. UWO 241]